jgi:hypothetical protein
MGVVNQGMPRAGGLESRRVREPSLADAVISLVTLVVLIAGSLLLFGLDALDGPIQVALVLCVLTAALIALKNGHSWDEVQFARRGPPAWPGAESREPTTAGPSLDGPDLAQQEGAE